MEDIKSIVATFKGISLADTCKRAALLERVDLKYVLKEEELPRLLSACTNYYAVLDINGNRLSNYETDYYDTADLYYYRVHHAGHLNRHKIRVRKYPDTGTGFLELKQKTNKGITHKTRTRLDMDSIAPIAAVEHEIFPELSDASRPPLSLSAKVDYQRITLVALDSTERVTIDLKLQFTHNDKMVELPSYVIAEVKQEKSASSYFTVLMKQAGVRKGALSKYCMAIYFLYEGVKKNRFKPYLNKIKHKTN